MSGWPGAGRELHAVVQAAVGVSALKAHPGVELLRRTTITNRSAAAPGLIFD